MQQHDRFLSASREATSLKHAIACVAFRASTWHDREGQLQKRFAWSPSRPRNKHCRYYQSLIRVSSLWSGYSRGRPHATSFSIRRTTGNMVASQIEEAA